MENRIKSLRLKKGLTQEDLGKVINVSGRSIGFYESGQRDPDTNTLKTLADFFDVSIDYLLGRVNDPQQKIIKKEDLPEDLAPYVDYIKILKDIDMSDITPEGLKMLIDAAQEFNKKNK